MPIHATDENFVRHACAALNKANLLGLSDSVIQAATSIQDLKDDYEALGTIHETDKNHVRHHLKAIQQMADLPTKDMSAPGTVVVTDVGTGGTLLANKTYNYKITAIDYKGNESLPSAVMNLVTANDGNNTHKGTLAALATVVGAESYRVYRKLSTAANYAGYLAATKAAIEAGTFADTGGTLIGSADVPSTSSAKEYVLTNAEVVAATGFTNLRAQITEESSESGVTFDPALDLTDAPTL